eukprot:scaffold98_cov307-Prasinococcus_capsulatus_cf.AAC.10
MIVRCSAGPHLTNLRACVRVRGQMYNFDPAVKQCVVKLASVALCANVSGQILMWLIMNPPKEGDASYELFAKERNAIIDSYRRRARVVVDGLRKVDSFTCNDVDGALYAFPQLKLAPVGCAALWQAARRSLPGGFARVPGHLPLPHHHPAARGAAAEGAAPAAGAAAARPQAEARSEAASVPCSSTDDVNAGLAWRRKQPPTAVGQRAGRFARPAAGSAARRWR